MNKTGGTWFSFLKSFPLLWHNKTTFPVSESLSKKGVQGILLNVNQIWPKKFLLLFNTHLDPNLSSNREKQVEVILQFMANSLKHIEANYPISEIGVLLIGDFNISSDWEEYSRLMKQLGEQTKVVDLFAQHFNQVQATNNSSSSSSIGKQIDRSIQKYTYEPSNSLATETHKSPRRIDYIFAFNEFSFPSSNSKYSFLPLDVKNFQILKQPYGKELSDHWPQHLELQILKTK